MSETIVSEKFDSYWRKQLKISESINVSMDKNSSSDKYEISINLSVGRSDIMDGSISDYISMIKNRIELLVSEINK